MLPNPTIAKGRWEVVGGAKGGVLVRDGQSTTSEQCLGMKVFPFLCSILNWFSRRFWNQPCSIKQDSKHEISEVLV